MDWMLMVEFNLEQSPNVVILSLNFLCKDHLLLLHHRL